MGSPCLNPLFALSMSLGTPLIIILYYYYLNIMLLYIIYIIIINSGGLILYYYYNYYSLRPKISVTFKKKNCPKILVNLY